MGNQMVDESIMCMDGLLREALELLQITFEHGLENCFSYMEEVEVMKQRFEYAGLAQGSVFWEKFYKELEFGKLSVGWETDEICFIYGELWRYVLACQRRLDCERAEVCLNNHYDD